ncbi:hypothetical protein KY285_032917 [Solanum tuberosum]|nr:hypothetical protein KY289_033026 [Solanum tuberosum]KAH0647669.1 hypothetical protein KY285_032917 [Solanum tuberosum]
MDLKLQIPVFQKHVYNGHKDLFCSWIFLLLPREFSQASGFISNLTKSSTYFCGSMVVSRLPQNRGLTSVKLKLAISVALKQDAGKLTVVKEALIADRG